jgi:hydrogenase nickel incorporation protein HypB
MCTACGCGRPDAGQFGVHDGPAHDHDHHPHHADDHQDHHGDHAHSHPHRHDQPHSHGDHDHAHDHPYDHAHPPAAGRGGTNAIAAGNRSRLKDARTFTLNLVSSPGAGKTSLLVRTVADLAARFAIAVIAGDQATDNDAARIRATGAVAVQVNTGKECQLDAHMVAHALDDLDLDPGGLLFIENVGNLICPAAVDLGEAHKVVVLSVTEGEDTPAKYPDTFAAADLMLLNKSDLLPHVDFDVGACLANALRVNPRLQTLVVSARTGDGMAAFYAWIEAHAALQTGAHATAPGP